MPPKVIKCTFSVQGKLMPPLNLIIRINDLKYMKDRNITVGMHCSTAFNLEEAIHSLVEECGRVTLDKTRAGTLVLCVRIMLKTMHSLDPTYTWQAEDRFPRMLSQ